MGKVNIEDFGGPKRPMSAYFLWMNENREKIQADLGTKNVGEVGKEAGERWKKVTAADRKKYEDKAEKAKADYEKTMAVFQKSSKFAEWKAAQSDAKEAKGEKVAGKKREREEGEPKRPQSAYFLWLNTVGREDLKKSSPDAKVTEIAKMGGETWGKMETKEKKPWEDKAEKLKAQYQKDVAEFKAKKARGGK